MKRFTDFFKNDFLILEQIEFLDRTLFSKIISEESAPTETEIADLDIELSNPETAKKYLNNEEELELIRIYKNDPNSQEGLDARNEVIENKLKYIYLLAQKAVNGNRIKPEHKQDAIQNAVLYLINGIDKFDESKGVPFTAYAKQWIMAGITNPFNPVRQKSISSDTVGKDSNFSLTSIDSPIGNGTSDDKEMTVGDMIPDANISNDPGEMIDADETRTKLGIFLKKLTDKEAKAIRLRFSTKRDGTERTLEEIGEELGMTKMGAKMLIDRTITKLKKFARDEQIQ